MVPFMFHGLYANSIDRRGERLPKNFELVTIKSNDYKTLQEQGYDIPAAISAKMNKSHR